MKGGIGISGGIPFAQVGNFNKEVRGWAKGTQEQLKQNVMRLTVRQHHGPGAAKEVKDEFGLVTGKIKALHESIRYSTKKNHGEIERVGFSFTKHGIFIHHGVGKGRPITSPGKPIDWFNPVLQSRIKLLADIVTKYDADAVVNATQMLIK